MSDSTANVTDKAHPILLSGLTTREQISDVLTRACLALDLNDRSMWESTWDLNSSADLTFSINGKLTQGLDAINKNVFTHAGHMDTLHLLTNVRIDVQEGASTARVTAYGLNQHHRPGQAMVLGSDHLLAGAMYDTEMVKDAASGEWKLRSWKLTTKWAQGTWAVMQAMME